MTEPLPVVQAIKLSPEELSSLARELAINIRELKDILPDYDITEEQFNQFIATNPYFKQALRALEIEWKSAESTKERMRLQAAAGLEAALPVLAARMKIPTEDLGKANEVAKLFSKLAGVDTGPAEGGGGKVTISIDLGGDNKLRFEKDVTPKAEKGSASPIPKITEGSG